MKRQLTILLLSLLPTLTRAADHEHHMTTAPTTGPVGVVSLDLCATGPHLHLLTATGSPAHLSYQVSNDYGHTWSTPTSVGTTQPTPSPIHRGMDAQLAASPDGQYLVAAWTTAGTTDRFGRGPIATALSADSGHTWTPGPNPADDGQSTGHAFLDLAADNQGAFHLVWLDGRDTTPKAPHENAGPSSSGKGLRYARSTDHGLHWSKNQTLDPETCECCWNTLLPRPDGSLSVLYRDRGPRDMAILSSPDSGHTWSAPTPVGPFAWDANVCPHVGGGLTFGTGTTAFATVWTGSPTSLGAYVLSSPDAGRSWSSPTRLGNDPRAWHTDLAYNPRTHRLAAVYDAHTDTTLGVFATTSNDDGKTWSPPVRLTPPTTSASHPRIIPTDASFRVFWTDSTTWTSTELPE